MTPALLRNKRVAAFLLLALCAGLASPVFGDSAAAFESDLEQEAARQAIYNLLFSFDRGNFVAEPETEGFHFYFQNRFSSAFDYNILGGHISSRISRTVIRFEGDTGDVRTMARILELENIIVAGSTTPAGEHSEAQPLEEKWHTLSQGLNLVAPWLSVLHASYNSPRLSTGQTVFRFFAYLLTDGLMVWVGGTNLFSEPFDAAKNGGNIAAALAIPRLIGAVQHFNLIRGHNRIANLGYTFYLDD